MADTEYIHGACEALLNAVQNKYYRVAEAIIKSTGNDIWKCAFSFKPCLVQSKFKRRKYDRSQEEKRTINVNYIMYILLSLTMGKVPGTVLQTLLQFGEKNLARDTEIDLQALNQEERKEVAKIQAPLSKFILCVCKLMKYEWKGKFDVTKLIKFYPPLASRLIYIDSHLIQYAPQKDDYDRMLHASITLLSNKTHWCKRNGKLEEIKLPANLSLLHVFSAVDNVDYMKTLFKVIHSIIIKFYCKRD